ncbi:MAG: ABC transporter ATP-binding protein/permease [Erysipelotrichaceae bacterium]|jgi:ATP-binding cassette subfamily B protein|nr:ABC transporter ATP-binding protein/permease [Erysipelotrichaceae bacterium]
MDQELEEELISKKFQGKTWSHILGYALKKWWVLLIIVCGMILVSFHDAALIPLMNLASIESIGTMGGKPLNEFLISPNIYGIVFTTNFFGFCMILFLGIITRAVAIFVVFYFTNYMERHILMSLRHDSFKKVQELSFSYFDKTPSGWIIARLQNDTAKLGDILSWGLLRVFWILVDLIFTLITVFLVDWKIALVIIATTPLLIVICPIFQFALLKLNRIARNSYSNFVKWLAECIAGSKTIKTLAIEKEIFKEANEVTENIRTKYYKAMFVQAFFRPSIQTISALGTAAVILIGIYVLRLDTATATSIPILTLALSFIAKIYDPIQEFAEVYAEFIACQASAEKIINLLRAPVAIQDRKDVIEKYGDNFHPKLENYEEIEGDIEFQDVSFSYNENIEIIHNLTLKIAKGTTIGLVGETGSGKTTTVNLLCRFYEPTSGSILIDGVEYRDRSLNWLRSQIGYVQQNPFIFNGDFFSNIRYGKLDATDEEIIEASKTVNLHEYVMSLPDGYKTHLEDQGNQLSLGQKQLISFARAIIRNPKIFILDEATSNIDTVTELGIQKSIKEILKSRTSIVIAHRLSTIVDVDKIVVFKDGKIIEQGDHRTLINLKQTYYNLYMNQFKELSADEQIETYETQLKDKLV